MKNLVIQLLLVPLIDFGGKPLCLVPSLVGKVEMLVQKVRRVKIQNADSQDNILLVLM